MNQAVPAPPVNATACDHCIVVCGCKIYRWLVDRIGGSKANQKTLKTDYPVAPLSGRWISPNPGNVVTYNGRLYNVVTVPDADTEVVNVGGDKDQYKTKTKILKPLNLSDAEKSLVEFLLAMSGEEIKLPASRMPAM